ncbi:hypothetical protein INR49_001255 [Caranx melampygus]|nr:hypothetical protein INR49_001255 [Caranx melampygus]
MSKPGPETTSPPENWLTDPQIIPDGEEELHEPEGPVLWHNHMLKRPSRVEVISQKPFTWVVGGAILEGLDCSNNSPANLQHQHTDQEKNPGLRLRKSLDHYSGVMKKEVREDLVRDAKNRWSAQYRLNPNEKLLSTEAVVSG